MENPYGAVLGRRDTRPIIGAWQREKSGKMMKSLKGWRPFQAFVKPRGTTDTNFGNQSGPGKN
jgi:hypothetical protein